MIGDVDPTAVLTPAAGVVSVAIGDETVIYRVATATSLVLNSTAGLLWQCLDSASALSEIVDDLSEAFGAEPSVVEEDCLAVVRLWLAQGLVEEVQDA